jgi:hypothetical protein
VGKLRDILLVVVLGGIVVWWAARFLRGVHEATVVMSPVIADAEFACIEDGMICHLGRDSFSSEQDAQAYLDSPDHHAGVEKRATGAAREKRDQAIHPQAVAMARLGVRFVRAACVKDGTLNCSLIDEATAESFAESIIRDRELSQAR